MELKNLPESCSNNSAGVDMATVYLDWNVFDKIEKLSSLQLEEAETFHAIEAAILSRQIIVPYSNAHINDLHRGFVKDPSYTGGHLATISRLTNNLCLAQYWKEKHARWHYRNPTEFLESTTEESDHMATSFVELAKFDDDPTLSAISNVRNNLLELRPMPEAFKKIYSVDPFFGVMYPKTKIRMTMLAFCEDLYEFSCRIKSDYALYKQYRSFLMQTKLRFQELRKTISATEQTIIRDPAYLTWDGIWEMAANNTATSNSAYDKVVRLFTTTDLKGYRQDQRFANLIDDAIHTFYAAHCDYFITIDKRCYDKAKKVYEDLKIATAVMTPQEYVSSRKEIKE